MCISEGCKKKSTHGFKGKKAIYCVTHKEEEMINIYRKSCGYENCKISPVYNFEGQTKALYCLKHKEDGMINIVDKTCIHKDCKIRPAYNFEGQTKALYCLNHKEEGMLNIKTKSCIYNGCKTQPVYNIEGQTKALYCLKHKLEGMIDIVNKNKVCIYNGCKTRSSYNFNDKLRGIYCVIHKQDGMVDVENKNKICKNSWCYTRVNKKYDGYCLFCYINLFPDKPTTFNYKTKEQHVVNFIKTRFDNLDWISDKIIKGGSSRRRPDLLLDLNYQVIIIEIDENQHIDYDCSCENKRIMELSQDVGHRPIVFIRFNPDDYYKNTLKISSCWNINKKGFCVIKKNKTEEWLTRLNCLENQIVYWLNPSNKTDKTVEIIQLFYDV